MHNIFFNRRQWIFIIGLLILFFFCLPALLADSSPLPSATPVPSTTTTPPVNTDPVPYTKEEFPDWALKLRRGEIVAFGTIPLTFILSYLAYDYIRFGVHMGDPNYNPLAPGHVPYSFEESAGVAITACSISICVALIDYWIGEAQAKNKKAKKLEEPTLDASR